MEAMVGTGSKTSTETLLKVGTSSLMWTVSPPVSQLQVPLVMAGSAFKKIQIQGGERRGVMGEEGKGNGGRERR